MTTVDIFRSPFSVRREKWSCGISASPRFNACIKSPHESVATPAFSDNSRTRIDTHVPGFPWSRGRLELSCGTSTENIPRDSPPSASARSSPTAAEDLDFKPFASGFKSIFKETSSLRTTRGGSKWPARSRAAFSCTLSWRSCPDWRSRIVRITWVERPIFHADGPTPTRIEREGEDSETKVAVL